ncbi:MAG TPA: transcription termination factor Rho [Myxococcales bacterium]|nr:transcription termination factor Rho [Myxococcales bacterium]
MNDNDTPDQTPAAPPAAAPPPAELDEGDDGGDDDGGEEEAQAGGAPAMATPAPGMPGLPGQGRRRRRRRRRGRGAPVLFTPEGQAYRMVAGPDGQQNQVFLTPQELQQYQQRMAQQQVQQGQRPQGAPQQAPQQQVQLQPVEGVLDTDVKGPNAFLRQIKRNLLATPDDPELPKNLVQKLRLRTGQYLTALAQMRGNKGIIQKVESVDGGPPESAPRLAHFNDLTSIDPIERIKLENNHREMVTRVLDLIAPLGKGQRALIVSPPKAGKTIMLQRIAQAVLGNHPEIHVMVLLIDERPEEVTDMRRSLPKAEVLASSSDRPTSDHLKITELALERARRMVEGGRDVFILLDSITRLARAYNKEIDSSGRTMTGGVDSRALERPKRIFGAARSTEEAGTLTIVGTALIDTGSRMDEVIFEEFKGTGNSEVTLDRLLSEKRVYPAINIPQSSTRKEEKLFTLKEYEKVKKLRQMLFAVKPVEAMEALVKRLSRYTYNDEFLDEL